MSKIGKKPITIPEGVTVNILDGSIEIKGKNASLSVKSLPGISASINEKELSFSVKAKDKQTMSNWGTMRALAANAIAGAVSDFTKELVIEGIGFRAEVKGNELVLNIGFSHPVNFPIPETIKIKTEKNTVKISGPIKELVGKVAAEVRQLKKVEPYLGKGIKYKDEIVRRKAGKKATASAGGKA
jgi:large subunit ribosomal protein L6